MITLDRGKGNNLHPMIATRDSTSCYVGTAPHFYVYMCTYVCDEFSKSTMPSASKNATVHSEQLKPKMVRRESVTVVGLEKLFPKLQLGR